MNRRWLGSVGLFLALCGVCRAQVPSTNRAATAHHCLWKITGRHNELFLLGSVHFLKPSDYPLAAPIEDAFNRSALVVFETDLAQLQQPEVQRKLMEKARLPAGQTLRQQLSPETYQNFENHLHDAGFSGDIFENLKPSTAAITLELLAMEKLGFDPDYGVDQHFFRRARAAGKQIQGLESVDFQIELLTDFSKNEGEMMMKTTLEDLDEARRELDQIVRSWRKGDAQALAKLLNHGLGDAPVLRRRLVTDRNRRWVPRLERLAQAEQDVLVVVGAGHLVGEQGVVALLRRRGWRITQE